MHPRIRVTQPFTAAKHRSVLTLSPASYGPTTPTNDGTPTPVLNRTMAGTCKTAGPMSIRKTPVRVTTSTSALPSTS